MKVPRPKIFCGKTFMGDNTICKYANINHHHYHLCMDVIIKAASILTYPRPVRTTFDTFQSANLAETLSNCCRNFSKLARNYHAIVFISFKQPVKYPPVCALL